MSIRAMNWAWIQSQPPAKKLVLMALADYAGEDDRCWPSVGTLAVKCGISSRTVQRVTQQFEQDGLIKIEERVDPVSGRRMSNAYLLKISDSDNLTPPRKIVPSNHDNLSGAIVTAGDVGEGDSTVSLHEPPKEPSIKPPQQPADHAVVPDRLYFPPQLSVAEKDVVIALIMGLNHDEAQTVLDELCDALETKSIRTTPLKWFRALIQRVRQGSFTPLGALRIAERRAKKTVFEKQQPAQMGVKNTAAAKTALSDAKQILALAMGKTKKSF